MGVPKRQQRGSNRYLELVGRKLESTAEARELINLGIQEKGTRVAATKHVVWHLVMAKRCSAAKATAIAVDWVYGTGKLTSVDVQADLRSGTRKVEKQTQDLVEYFIARREEHADASPPRMTKRFTVEELDAIVAGSLSVKARDQKHQALFVLNLLNLAKAHGKNIKGVWQARAAAQQVLRTWKGCSGTRYKKRLDEAIKCGLVSIVKPAWHNHRGRGRARKFAIHVPCYTSADQQFTYPEACDFIAKKLSLVNFRSRSESDTDSRIVSLKEINGNRQASVRKLESVVAEEEFPTPDHSVDSQHPHDCQTVLIDDNSQSPSPGKQTDEERQHSPSTDRPMGKYTSSRPGRKHSAATTRDTAPSRQRPSRFDYPPLDSNSDEGHQYPRSTTGDLGKGSAERQPLWDALQRLSVEADHAKLLIVGGTIIPAWAVTVSPDRSILKLGGVANDPLESALLNLKRIYEVMRNLLQCNGLLRKLTCGYYATKAGEVAQARPPPTHRPALPQEQAAPRQVGRRPSR